MNGQKIQRRMTVDEISFSAHVDFAQNSSFIKQVNPQHIVSCCSPTRVTWLIILSGVGAWRSIRDGSSAVGAAEPVCGF